jgi:hypothetical protein
VVFVRPQALVYENFRGTEFGRVPAGWKISARGGVAAVVDVPDYDAEIRPSSFELTTVRRYVPLDLRALKLESATKDSLVTAEYPFSQAATSDLILDYRLKPGQADQRSELALISGNGEAVLTVAFTEQGTLTARGTSGPETTLSRYEPAKWYTIKIRFSSARGETTVEVQDDQLKVVRSDRIQVSRGDLVQGLSLRHRGSRAGTLVTYNALSAYVP